MNNESVVKDLILIGGKLWERGAVKRIYLDKHAVVKLLKLDDDKLTAFEQSCLKKSKTYYDCIASEYKSDVGTVRVLFNQNGFSIKK
jgi:hypothetical protein